MSEDGDVAGLNAGCAVHDGQPAVGICDRCGSFVCTDCSRSVSGKRVCATCLERPEVNYLAEFKRKMWGRRDGFVWWFGIMGSLGALAFTVLGLVGALERPVVALFALNGLVTLGVFVCYFLLMPWARWGLFLLLPMNVLVQLAMSGDPDALGPALGAQILPLIFFLAAYTSPMNKLAFRIEIPEKKLRKIYETYYDNQMARAGLVLGMLSIVVPGLALIALPLSIAGLKRADPDGWPPVGRRRSAIAGIVTSSIGLALTLWTAYLVVTG